jgi:DNA-binding LacI/PurR family transcriptional regulator
MSAQDPPLYFHVLASLRVDCLGGVAYGHRLPSEPDLAKRYGVSRTTIRRAIATLIEEGVLEVRHGAGTFIRPGAGRSRTIGLIVAEGVAQHPDDPYAQQLINNLMMILAQHGWTLRLARSAEDMRSSLACEHGAIVSACVAAFFGATDDLLHPLAVLPVPLVLLDSELHPDFACIMADNAPGMRQAVQRVIELGHREIVHLAGPDWALTGRERSAGFREAMATAGLTLRDGDITPGAYNVDSGYATMAGWWAAGRRPTAVLCGNDLMALGAMHWLFDHGLRPGIDVSIVGCDNIAFAGLSRPALATIALDFVAHAQAVLDAVLDVHRPCVRRTAMHLIERASLGPVPVKVQ